MNIHLTLPLRLESTANKREHWAPRARRTKTERTAVALALRAEAGICAITKAQPLTITLVRIAPRQLDPGDNLNVSLKGCRDGVADWLMTKDNNPLLTWAYSQRKGSTPHEYGVEILITGTEETIL